MVPHVIRARTTISFYSLFSRICRRLPGSLGASRELQDYIHVLRQTSRSCCFDVTRVNLLTFSNLCVDILTLSKNTNEGDD